MTARTMTADVPTCPVCYSTDAARSTLMSWVYCCGRCGNGYTVFTTSKRECTQIVFDDTTTELPKDKDND